MGAAPSGRRVCAPAILSTQPGYQYIRGLPVDAERMLSAVGAQLVSGGLSAAAVRHDLVRDLLAIPQSGQSSAFNSTDVNEHIGAARGGLNEAIALLGVEPLHGTCLHESSFQDASAS